MSTQIPSRSHPSAAYGLLPCLLWALTIYFLITTTAHADSLTFILCDVADMVMGNLGRGLATCAVLVIGVGATLGKVPWGLAITVAVGISVIFNAPLIVLALGLAGGGC